MDFVVGDALVRVNAGARAALMAELDRRLAAAEGFMLATLNLDHLVKLRRDRAFRAAYAGADLVTADGRPVTWMARLAGQRVELMPGADLLGPVARVAAARGVGVGLLGATEATLAAAARNLADAVPGLDLRLLVAPPMGLDPEGPEARAALDRLAASGVRLVVLALGAPKQERLAAMGRARHPAMGFLCTGAGLDFWAGRRRRAPAWIRAVQVEWLWRLALEPRRLGPRYLRCAIALPRLAVQARRMRSRRGRAAAGRTLKTP